MALRIPQLTSPPAALIKPRRPRQRTRQVSVCSTEDVLAIQADKLNVSFKGSSGHKQVLKRASLEVPEGSFHILLGPNGCGKSTLLRALGGLLTPDSGTVTVNGPHGFVFQNPDHQLILPTVAADVAFGLGRMRLAAEEVHARVQRALKAVSMEEYADRPVHTLSGGQKQRAAIAGVLAQDPKVLLLDELTTFLDDDDRDGVITAVKGLVGGLKVTALWVTHRLEELPEADSASYMEDGRVTMTGSPRGVARHLAKLGAKVPMLQR